MKRIFSPRDKASIALEAVKELKTPNQIGSERGAHPVQIGIWKKQLVENAHLIFSGERREEEREREVLIERLYKVIGQRDIELDWLKKKLHLES